MGTEVLERRFAAIGARLNVVGPPTGAPRIDVGSDARGEFFDIRFEGSGRLVELEVVDVDVTARRRASSCAATTSGTGSSRRSPRKQGALRGSRPRRLRCIRRLSGQRLAGHGRRIPSAAATRPTSARASGSSSRRSSSTHRPCSFFATSRCRVAAARRT